MPASGARRCADAGGEIANGLMPYLRGMGIAGFHGGDKIGGRVETPAAARAERMVPHGILKAPGSVEESERPFGMDGEVAEMSGTAGMTAEQPPV